MWDDQELPENKILIFLTFQSSVKDAIDVMMQELRPKSDNITATIKGFAEDRYEEDARERDQFAARMRASIMADMMGENIDESVILEDVVNGHYSIADVKVVTEGRKSVENPADTSVIQLFDRTHEMYKEENKEVLIKKNAKELLEAFEAVDLKMMAVADIDELVMNATIGIDMNASMRTQRRECLEAFDAFHKAEIMISNEKCLKNSLEILRFKKQETQRLMDQIDYAEAGPSGHVPPQKPLSGTIFENHPMGAKEGDEPKDESDAKQPPLEFSIRYDFSLLPSEDPDVYKPLEIVSYIGMTKPVGVAVPV